MRKCFMLLLKFAIKAFAILQKEDYCKSLSCKNETGRAVCGIKEESEGFRIRLFENECALLKYGCEVEKGKEYGLTTDYYCDVTQLGLKKPEEKITRNENKIKNYIHYENKLVIHNISSSICKQIYCVETSKNNNSVCAIKKNGKGFRIRRFPNKCHLQKFNCLHKLDFKVDNSISCDDINMSRINESYNSVQNNMTDWGETNKIIVINGSMLDYNGNLNDTIDEFFASTHYIKLPLKEMNIENEKFNNTRRKQRIRIASPIKVFEPWINIPKKKSNDHWHAPTISSCYHRCPQKCPETYAPVCGVPGVVSREPSLMFQNHCFMDKAQCKMYWEDKSETSSTSGKKH